ncbi:MAG: c-type cytochrome [Geminicoccaceae bacterium]
MMKTTGTLPAIITVVMMSSSTFAADVEHGEMLARQWCSNCHVIKADQAVGGDTAPTFASIAETSVERTDDLRAWLADPHPPMPNFDLTRREIDDLLAYIESLRPN